jgi:ribosomal-protein-alanine N-acetyltransferase
VTRFLTFRPHQSISGTAAYIARGEAAPTDESRTFELIERFDSCVVGAFELRSPEPHRPDCGYVLARSFWGRGLMTEALIEVAAWASRQNEIWRIGAVCDTENLASARVIEKAGLQREGILGPLDHSSECQFGAQGLL